MASSAPTLTLRRPDGLGYDPDVACRHLAQIDPRLGALMEQAGPFTMRPVPTQSLFAALGEVWRGGGLSAAKTAALKDLAAKTLDGTVPSLAQVRRMDDEAIIERLTEVRGIGRWTVEMLLIFRLGRPDVLPLTDLGVRKGFGLTFRRGRLPDPAVMLRRAERWRPYRSVASWYMWRALEL